jgi:cyclase
MRLPTRTFSGALTLDVAGRRVELVDIGPAHTRSDVIAYVPDARTVFTGDILFVAGTPIIWAGPVSNWLAACRYIEALDVDTIVPGHGPVTDKRGPRDVRRYLEFVRDETAQRQQAGMTAEDAAGDIELGEFADLADPERIVINVESIYRELDPGHQPAFPPVLFARMGAYRRDRA